MANKHVTFNPKRRIRIECDSSFLAKLADSVRYSGSPVHKKNPGDFGLSPPALPRPTKTLCDGVEIFSKEAAMKLIREGVRRGLISVQERNGFPQNIWAVSPGGEPLEAQLGNEAIGIYHGYPMPSTDPFRIMVIKQWRANES